MLLVWCWLLLFWHWWRWGSLPFSTLYHVHSSRAPSLPGGAKRWRNFGKEAVTRWWNTWITQEMKKAQHQPLNSLEDSNIWDPDLNSIWIFASWITVNLVKFYNRVFPTLCKRVFYSCTYIFMENTVNNMKVIKIELHFYSQTIASKTVPYFDLNKRIFSMQFSNRVSIQYIFIKVACPYQLEWNVFLKFWLRLVKFPWKKKYSILRRICLQILNAKLDSNVTIATEKWNYSSITTSDSINSV